MIVLSLFDGMACGYEALKRAGVSVERYYASEIDPYAIQIAKKNHPDIIHLGDVEAWYSWDIPKPDLIIGGSPCQGFSYAGKQLNFDDPRSRLFFDMVDILEYWNPDHFLLENVKMKQEWVDVITSYMGIEPHFINSALVSAQNRQRLYWYNWFAPDPEDRGILLKDIVLDDKNFVLQKPRGKNGGGIKALDGKSPTVTSSRFEQNNLLLSQKAIDYMDRAVRGGRNHWDFAHHSDLKNAKSAAVVANFYKGVPYNVLVDGAVVRKFHPIECERLQTLPDNYTDGVSNTQRYKMIGNGWTVEVIRHLLTFL